MITRDFFEIKFNGDVSDVKMLTGSTWKWLILFVELIGDVEIWLVNTGLVCIRSVSLDELLDFAGDVEIWLVNTGLVCSTLNCIWRLYSFKKSHLEFKTVSVLSGLAVTSLQFIHS